MSERKVLNKYFPPDFDPALIPRRKGPKNSQQVVRLMAPFSMRCNTCGEYIYKGKKFNARKETVEGEDYYGIKIFRFYIKCTLCSAEITFKTDPKNTDYAAEHGASRNFEPWREEKANRTVDSKREMDVLDALHDIRARNARNERMGQSDDLVARLGLEEVLSPEDEQRRREEEEDERLVREVFSKADDVEPDLKSLLPESTRAMVNTIVSGPLQPGKKKKADNSKSLGIKLFIDTTFEKAEPNVRINGKNFEEVKDGDDALDRETWSLYNERLQWDLELATKRRKRPQETVKTQRGRIGRLKEAEEEVNAIKP
ncbi:hypothetical protein H4582DRAFT_2114087 [Lactarius indigo]|nr:hypothetical protein H4582DRAFT_2114087 [Lactarius indigo]